MSLFFRNIFIIFLIFSSFLFADSGFKMNIILPVGGTYSVYEPIFKQDVGIDSIYEYNKDNGDLFVFESGFEVLPGYLFDFNNDLGIGLFGNIGYSYDFFGFKRLSFKEQYNIHSVKLGFDSKLYFSDFAFGLGFGIKVPFYIKSQLENYGISGTINYSANSLNNILVNPLFTYIQFSADYIFDLDNFDLGLGLYFGYDFALSLKTIESVLSSMDFYAFDFGLRLSFIIGESI